MRVCVIYGSESGTAERGIRTIAKGWKESKGIEVSSIMEGADAARIGLASLAEQYDFLAVATSSNGEGDPPFNFHPFLKALYEADDAGDKPLTGCGFAVLGFGCSHFDTFQNCPRLTDKYLEEAGSRRFVARHETDVGGEEDEGVNRKLFREAVAAVLKKGLPAASAAPAAAWASPRAGHDEPTDQITEKTEFQAGHKQSLGQMLVPALAISVAAAAFVYTQYFMEGDEVAE